MMVLRRNGTAPAACYVGSCWPSRAACCPEHEKHHLCQKSNITEPKRPLLPHFAHPLFPPPGMRLGSAGVPNTALGCQTLPCKPSNPASMMQTDCQADHPALLPWDASTAQHARSAWQA